jgi:hypothetical protein
MITGSTLVVGSEVSERFEGSIAASLSAPGVAVIDGRYWV